MYTPPRKSFGLMSAVDSAVDSRPLREAPERRERIERPVHEPRPVHDARLLTAGGPDAEILLDGQRYILRITRQGKLILTK